MGTTTRADLTAQVLEATKLVSGTKGWTTMEELSECVISTIPPDSWDVISTAAKKDFIRRAVQTEKDDNGLRCVESVVTTLPDGTDERRYKQRELFDEKDYRFAVSYRISVAKYHYDYAKALASECFNLHHVQLTLPVLNGK